MGNLKLMHFARLANTLLKYGERARTRQSRCCIFAKYSQILIFYSSPPHLKYVATLPCNLSLLACFADVNVSQGSVATYARCGGIFNIHLTANLPRNLLVKKITSVNIWQNYDDKSVAPLFGPPCSHGRFCGLPATRARNVKGKVFPYSLPSVGPGADPGVQAVSPQVTWSESRHRPGSRLPLFSARPAVTSVTFTRWRYLSGKYL